MALHTGQRTQSGGRFGPPEATIEWHESADVAEHHMRAAGTECLRVVDGGQLLGWITLGDIERCERHGNWLGAVMVRDLLPVLGSS